MDKVDWLLIASYIIIALVFAFYAKKKKKKNWLKVFLLSIILTPITSAYLLFYSKKAKLTYNVDKYRCPRCEFKFDDKMTYCPICLKEGEEVELVVVSVIMT